MAAEFGQRVRPAAQGSQVIRDGPERGVEIAQSLLQGVLGLGLPAAAGEQVGPDGAVELAGQALVACGTPLPALGLDRTHADADALLGAFGPFRRGGRRIGCNRLGAQHGKRPERDQAQAQRLHDDISHGSPSRDHEIGKGRQRSSGRYAGEAKSRRCAASTTVAADRRQYSRPSSR